MSIIYDGVKNSSHVRLISGELIGFGKRWQECASDTLAANGGIAYAKAQKMEKGMLFAGKQPIWAA